MRWSIKLGASVVAAVAALSLIGCSTTGGIYSANDSENSEFSVGRTVLGILGIAAAIGTAKRAGGGGGGGSGGVDYDWAWDQFRNEYGQFVWACRGKQTGEFADQVRCQFKPMNDFTWPGP